MAINTISFDTVPGSIRVPGQYIEFNTRNAVQGLPTNPQSILIVGPMLSTGTQSALAPVQVYNENVAADLFGAGSWAHLMVRQALINNAYADLTVIGIADHASGVAATSTVTVSGTATSTGVAQVVIAGVPYSTAVASGDTANAIAARIKAVIDLATACPVTATVTNAVITLTAKCKGEIGNEITISASNSATASNITKTDMASGAKNADIQTALDKVAGKQYHIIVSPFADDANAKALSNHVTQVSNAIEQRGCIGVLGWRGTLATGTAYTARLNDGRLTCAWYKNATESCAIIAAGYAAILAGEEDPAKPLNTLEVKGLSVTSDDKWPLLTEANNALYNGLTPLTVVANKVQIMRALSTYTKSANNTTDPSLLDITTIRTLDYVRRAVKERIALRFPRDKLSDRLLPKVKSEILDVLIKLDDAEIIENAEANKSKLVVIRNASDVNRVDAAIPADVVNGLHVFAGRIDLIL